MKIYWQLIKWSVKTLLMLAGVMPLFRCGSGYKERDGKITFNGEEITDKNFIFLNDVFAKDDSSAYYKRYSIESADIHSFVGIDKHYAKDKSFVYYCDEEREGQNYFLTKHSVIFKVQDAHPRTFEIMGEGYEGYAKDAKRAYLKGIGFEVKDVSSLTILEGQFLMDKFLVYFDQVPVNNADVNSFRILNNSYARDTARAYYYGYHSDVHNGINEIPCEVDHLTILEYPYSKDNRSAFYLYKEIEGSDASTFSVIGNDFSKDKNHVYVQTKILKGADANSFRLVPHDENSLDDSDYTMDNYHVFWKDKMLPEVNNKTFKVLGLGYATDGNCIFFQSDIVKNADPSSFKTYDHSYGDFDAEDARHKYLEGIKVLIE